MKNEILDKRIISKRIQEARFELQITQYELAKHLGYKNGATISKIEGGESLHWVNIINRYSKILNKPVTWLLGIDDITDDKKESVNSQQIISNSDLEGLNESKINLLRSIIEVLKKEDL